MAQRQKQLGRGASSIVSRPSILPQGQSSFVLKTPHPFLGQNEKLLVHNKYIKQKQILDGLHQKIPSKSHLFNQIYKITPQGVRMKDLGNWNLSKIRRMTTYSYPFLNDFDNIVAQLIDACVAMWKIGIAHKDIKPANIMADYDETTGHFSIALVDFTDSLMKETIENSTTFYFAGTTKYMSPEMLRRKYSQPTKDKSPGTWEEYVANDLWSLGMVLYFLMYNQNPVDMFKKMYFFQGTPQQKQQPENKILYEYLEHWPHVYDTLFPTDTLPDNQKQYVPMIKTLLSFDPKDRLRWLSKKFRQQQQQTRQVLGQRPTKRTRKQQPQSFNT